MARRRKKRLTDLLKEYEPLIQGAFLSSIEEIKSEAVLADIEQALKNHDIEAAIGFLYVEPAAYRRFQNSRATAYIAGGDYGVSSMPRDPAGNRLLVRFDARAIEAEEWLGTKSAQNVTNLVDEEISSLRASLEAAMTRGDGPSKMALDIVGRKDPKTGRRKGGIIGLSAPQKQAVEAAREELSSLATMAKFKQRKSRNKNFDRYINRALKDDRPLTDKEIEAILGGYSDKLLMVRGETIGRTEAMGALHAGRREAYLQAVANGKVTLGEVYREWDSTGDTKVRHSHRALDGEQVGLDEPYISPTGARIMYPGDPDAPAEEVINCRCDETYRIDFLARVGGPSQRRSTQLRAEDVTRLARQSLEGPRTDRVRDRAAPGGGRS